MKYILLFFLTGAFLFGEEALFYKQLCEKYAKEYEAIYAQIPDITNPSYNDLLLVQNYIQNGPRKYLSWLNHLYPEQRDDGFRMDLKMRTVRLINPSEPLNLHLQKVFFNKTPHNKETCIITYASYNANFVRKIHEMSANFKEVGFKGHFLYRVGGWPNIQGGSLKLAHVPYAFKACMFKEAQRLGYKKVLWLDTSFHAYKNFDHIFDILEKDGYYISTISYSLMALGSEMMRHSLNLTEEEGKTQKSVAGGIVGINFEHENGIKLLESWYKAAEELGPFLSPRSDQVALGALAYKLGLPHTVDFFDICAIDPNSRKPNHYFLVWY